jgi:Restriction Enzyme Adenine Methylase Associated
MKRPRARERVARSLVVHRLENVSKEVFKQYFPLITELIGSSPGLYALYDDDELYYVGKSRDLRFRVRAHLRDRHLASWTHFSLYLVRRSAHIGEIESLLVRVANPKGNRVVPRSKGVGSLLRELKSLIRQKQRQDFESFFGRGRKALRRVLSRTGRKLANLVRRPTKLYRRYKGREYTAILHPSGTITGNGGRFKSPTAAARAIARSTTVNGWTFWYARDSHGEWVKLRDLRR